MQIFHVCLNVFAGVCPKVGIKIEPQGSRSGQLLCNRVQWESSTDCLALHVYIGT